MNASGSNVSKSWLLLHGFGGGQGSWGDLQRLAGLQDACVPPLLGHGTDRGQAQTEAAAISADEGGFMAEVDRLGRLATDSLGAPFKVCGYSLGGRLALGLASIQPSLVERLVLVGVNPGLELDEERTKRAKADERWAQLIELKGLDHFFEEWLEQPLFASQSSLPPDRLAGQTAVRSCLHATGLARAMRNLSLARMPDFGKSLALVSCPVDLVVGELDLKFGALAESMAQQIPRCRITRVPEVGHNVLLEAPDALAAVLVREGPH